MNALACSTRTAVRAAVAAIALAACAAASAQPKTRAPRIQHDGATPHIDAVILDPEVARHIAAWGLSGADVQAQVASLSAAERARLAYLLHRHWRIARGQSTAALQARYLVTFALLREAASGAGSTGSGAAQR